MQKPLSQRAILLLLLVLLGCAASSSGNKNLLTRFMADLDTATSLDFKEKSQRELNKYQYQLERYEEFGNILYFETQWKDRELFADEQSAGIVEAKSRIILEARPYTRNSSGVTLLNKVQLFGENLVIYENTQAWVSAPLSPMCQAYFKQFAEDLRADFRTGFRKY